MHILKQDFQGGGRAPLAQLSADWLNTVARILNDLDGIGCHIDRTTTGYGWRIVVDGARNDAPECVELFDLYGCTQTTVKIRGAYSGTDLPAAFIGGTLFAVSDGAAGYTLDDAIDMAAEAGSRWAYLAVDRAVPQVTLELADAASPFPNGTDTVEHFPLWLLRWDSVGGHIGTCVRLTGGARWLAEGPA
jgi:hypothetical protein